MRQRLSTWRATTLAAQHHCRKYTRPLHHGLIHRGASDRLLVSSGNSVGRAARATRGIFRSTRASIQLQRTSGSRGASWVRLAAPARCCRRRARWVVDLRAGSPMKQAARWQAPERECPSSSIPRSRLREQRKSRRRPRAVGPQCTQPWPSRRCGPSLI